jgi:hypothetical protein
MTDYSALTNSQVEPNAPVTSELVTALRDNPIAIAEGSIGSPEMEVAWHYLEYKQLTGGDANTLTMDTDISSYRAVRLVGGATYAAAGSADLDIRLNIGGYRTVTSTTLADVSPNLVSVMFDAVIWNIDGNDGYDYKLGRTTVANLTTGGGSAWDDASQSAAATTYMGLARYSSAATAIQIYNGGGGSQQFNGGDAHAMLYGVKRTTV